jgi:hypothetical protein
MVQFDKFYQIYSNTKKQFLYLLTLVVYLELRSSLVFDVVLFLCYAATSGAGTAYPSGAPEFNPLF